MEQRAFEGGMGNAEGNKEMLKAESSKSQIRKNQPEALTIQTNLTFLTIQTI